MSHLPQEMEGLKMMEMHICLWIIWMAMLMNVFDAEQEDEVDQTGTC
jgi:hypothetical protein